MSSLSPAAAVARPRTTVPRWRALLPLGLRLLAGALLIVALWWLPEWLEATVPRTRFLRETLLPGLLVYAIFAMSLDLLLGYTGIASLGHAAFFGLGAYGAGILATKLSQDFLPATLLAVVLAAFGALLIGAVAIRARGVYLLMLTLALAQVLWAAADKAVWLTGGSDGLTGVPKPKLPFLESLFGRSLSDPLGLYWLLVLCFLLALGLLVLIVHSGFGRVLVGIRENEARMRAIGYNTYAYKLAAFVIAGALAGLAGALFVFTRGGLTPQQVYWTTSGEVLIMVIVGGAGTLLGPAFGAALILALENLTAVPLLRELIAGSALPEFLRAGYQGTPLQATVEELAKRRLLVLGVVFILFVLFARQGLAGLFRPLLRGVWPEARLLLAAALILIIVAARLDAVWLWLPVGVLVVPSLAWRFARKLTRPRPAPDPRGAPSGSAPAPSNEPL